MPYLIDGHNLIGQLPDLNLDDPDDEAKLVQKLMGFVARTKARCIVVFDHGLPAGLSRMSTGGVKVIFASHQEDADTVIIRRIFKEKNPRIWTVVSNDHRVLNTAKRQGMIALKSIEFVSILKRPPPLPKPDVSEAADVKLTSSEVDEWLTLFNDDN
jgi:predicted RNA-binding protein with PIN domain